MDGGGQWLHAFRGVPALRRVSGALLTFAVLLAGGIFTKAAARAALASE